MQLFRRIAPLCILLASLVHASDRSVPKLRSVVPEALQRGGTIELNLAGENLQTAERVVASPDPGVAFSIIEKKPGTVRVSAVVKPDAALGEVEVRVVTATGATNPVQVAIGLYPVVKEVEPNNSAGQPQAIALPALITGVIQEGADADCFGFEARKGEELVFETLASRVGSKLDSSLRVLNAAGKTLAVSEDDRDFDSYIRFAVPADGAYVLQLRDFRYMGAGDYNYRLFAGRLPYLDHIFPLGGQRGTEVKVSLYGENLAGMSELKLDLKNANLGRRDVRAETPSGMTNGLPFDVGDFPESIETEPNNEPKQANSFTAPGVLNGRLGEARDVDIYKFKAAKAEKLVCEVTGSKLGSPIDAFLVLMDANGKVLDQKGDAADLNAQLEFTPTAGVEYLLAVRDLHDRGGEKLAYRLTVAPPKPVSPGFSAKFVPDSFRVSRGSRAKLWFEVSRTNGFKEAVKLTADGLPGGVTIEAPTLDPGSSGIVAIAAAADAPIGTYPIKLILTGTVDKNEVKRDATPVSGVRGVRQAFLTVLDAAPFTVEPVKAVDPAEEQKVKSEIAELEKKLNTQTPELDTARSKWEEGAKKSVWVAMDPLEMKATSKATFKKMPDASVLVEGENPPMDTYTVKAKTDLQGIVAFRLEVQSDSTLPAMGPGRNANGNFVLTEFKIKAETGGPAKDVKLQNAKADFSQTSFPIENTIDARNDTGWAIAGGGEGKSHIATFETKEPVGADGGTTLTFTFEHLSQYANHNVGKFLLAVTTSKTATESKPLPGNIQRILWIAPDKRDEKQKSEIDAYYRGIAPELTKDRDRLAVLKNQTGATYPPEIVRKASAPLGVTIRRAPNFKGEVTLTLEGFAAGNENGGQPPFTKNFDAAPAKVKGDSNVATMPIKAKDNAEIGTRMMIVRAEATVDKDTYVEYSEPIPLTVLEKPKEKAAEKKK